MSYWSPEKYKKINRKSRAVILRGISLHSVSDTPTRWRASSNRPAPTCSHLLQEADLGRRRSLSLVYPLLGMGEFLVTGIEDIVLLVRQEFIPIRIHILERQALHVLEDILLARIGQRRG